MNGNVLDTNVIVRILNGDRNLVQQLSKFDNLCSCSIVLGELLYGAAKSAHSKENREKAKSFYSRFNFLLIDENVAEEYGKLKNTLLSHGNVMPENDMWIAAVAIANNMSVITQDKHFELIPCLSVVKL